MQVGFSTTTQMIVNYLATSRVNATAGANAGTQPLGSDYITGALNAVSISAFGRQINAFYAALGGISDPQARQTATRGLTEVMQAFINDPQSARTASFFNTLQGYGQSDPAFFQSFFTTAGRLAAEGQDVGRWTNTFVELGDSGTERGFVGATGAILDAGSGSTGLGDTLNQFLDSVNRILGSGLGAEAQAAQFADFFGGLGQATDLSGKRDFMSHYPAGNG